MRRRLPTRQRFRTGRGYGHTRYDTLDKVEMKYLHLAAANYTRFLFRVANEENWNPQRKTKAEIEDFIKEQGYDQDRGADRPDEAVHQGQLQRHAPRYRRVVEPRRRPLGSKLTSLSLPG